MQLNSLISGMIRFTALISKFDKMGEKTGWTYVIIPEELAVVLNGASRRSIRVSGTLDAHPISSVALLPRGDGSYILPLNAAMRKATGKSKGMHIEVQVQQDKVDKPLSKELLECLDDEPAARAFFYSLGKGHQRYFSNWVNAAKTAATQAKRIAHCVNYLSQQKDFGTMLRAIKEKRQQEF
jgi:hypothetical protein